MNRCPLCDSCENPVISTEVSGAPESSICRCRNCSLVYLFPTMSPVEEGRFYEHEFPGYMEERAGGKHWKEPEQHFQEFLRNEGHRRSGPLLKHLTRDHQVLEVGCATGYLLELLRPAVGSVVGVEPGPGQREYARGRGLEVHPSMDELGERRFDAVLCYYVLEHITQPVAFLRRLASALKPGGRLIVEVPNLGDVLLSRYGIKNFPGFYYQKMHVTYFTRETLGRALSQAGLSFEILPEQRYDLSNHLVWMRDGKPGGMGRFQDFLSTEVEAAYAEALKRKWLCDTLLAVAEPA